MARHQWTLALILICIPILATVITAFRVRDLPKGAHETERVDLKKQKCDDCEVNELKVGQKLHSVKIESAKRSYEDLKKATREKLQASQKSAEVKSSFTIKHVSDEDDDDFDDLDFQSSESGLKGEQSVSKNEKTIAGLKLELKSKKLPQKNVNKDDDDENDGGKVKAKFVKDAKEKISDVKSKDSSKERKSVKISSKEIDDDEDDEDDDDDDEDDDDDKETLKTKSRLDKISKDIKEKKLEMKLKEPEPIKKPVKSTIKVKYDDDDDDDDSDDEDEDDDNGDDDDDDDDDDEDDDKVNKVKKTLPITHKEKSEPEPANTKEKKIPAKEIRKDVFGDDVKSKKEAKADDSADIKPASKKTDTSKKDTKIETLRNKEDPKNTKDQTKPVKVEPAIKPVSKQDDKKEQKAPKSIEEKKVEPAKTEKPIVKPKTQEQKTPKEEVKKPEKKSEPEAKKKDENIVKPKTKEKSESEHKKHSEKDGKKDKSSKETLADSRESLSKTETHLKHVTDALHRRNLLQSEFEDFYAFFPTFAPNFSRIHNPECRRHGQIVLRQLRGTKLWAFSMLDATAKIPSGILQGNGIQLGDFDQCLGSRARVQLESGSVVKVQGQYCLARLDVKAEQPELELAVHLALAKNLIKSRIDDPGHFVPRFSTLSWGVCVPAACNPEDVEVVLKDALKHYQYTSGLVLRVKVDPTDCHSQEGADWWEDWLELPTLLTLGFYGLILLLVLVATLQDYLASRKPEVEQSNEESEEKEEAEQKETENGETEESEPKKSKDGVLSAFSLYRTVSKLLAPGTEDEIACIHGIRGLATIALLVAHKFLPVAVMPYTNRLMITEIVSSPLWSWCRAGWLFTDCFLLLSGALLAHRLSADSDTGAPWRLFSRYLRLTPAMLAVVLFYAYVWDNISSGPMWGTFVTKNAEICQESWWWNLFYVQNYFGFEEMCAPQTHQLALDMQLTILGSALVWALNSELIGARFLIPGIHAITAYSKYTTVQEHRLTMLAYHGVSLSQLYRTARLSYTSALHRCTPYLIGLSLGQALRTPAKHGKFVVIVGWLTTLGLWSAVLWAGWDSGVTTYKYNAVFAAQYATFAPFASALGIAWVIYIVHNQHSELLSNLLSCRFLVFISRLSYALYLSQFIIFLTNVGTVRTSTEFSLLALIDFQEIFSILLTSVILTLTFVIPMQSLHKLFKFSFSSKPSEEVDESAEKSDETEGADEKPEENNISQPPEAEIEEIIEVPVVKRQHLVAHREVLEEIPEVEVEFEMQREKNEGLEEILEEEEEDEQEEEKTLDDDDLEIIEEEQGGEDDIWEGRDEYTPRRVNRRQDDDGDLDEWEWTTNGNGRSGAQYYRYSR